MEKILELAGLYPEGESERGFRFECRGDRIGVGACGERLRPYGGRTAWSHYLERVGTVENLALCFPVARTSPKATPVRDVLPAQFIADWDCLGSASPCGLPVGRLSPASPPVRRSTRVLVTKRKSPPT